MAPKTRRSGRKVSSTPPLATEPLKSSSKTTKAAQGGGTLRRPTSGPGAPKRSILRPCVGIKTKMRLPKHLREYGTLLTIADYVNRVCDARQAQHLGFAHDAFEENLVEITLRRSCIDSEGRVYDYIGVPWSKMDYNVHWNKAEEMGQLTGQAALVDDLVEKVLEQIQSHHLESTKLSTDCSEEGDGPSSPTCVPPESAKAEGEENKEGVLL